jgi:hypothetical protein
VDAPSDAQQRRFPPPGTVWRIAAMAALAIVAVYALSRAIAPDESADSAQIPLPVGPTTTGVAAPPLVTTTRPPVATTMAATTLPPETTTTTATTTTTVPPTTTAPPPTIAVVGDPIPIENLTLSILGIGPLDFGDPADRVLGRLAATFGQPDSDSGPIAAGEQGTCDDGVHRIVRWGALSIVTSIGDTAETFHSFRIDLRNVDEPGPGAGLLTLSGFAAGATIAEFEDTYIPGFRVAYLTDPEEGLIFELSSQQGLLLWGPVTSSDADGVVQGIFSADAC